MVLSLVSFITTLSNYPDRYFHYNVLTKNPHRKVGIFIVRLVIAVSILGEILYLSYHHRDVRR